MTVAALLAACSAAGAEPSQPPPAPAAVAGAGAVAAAAAARPASWKPLPPIAEAMAGAAKAEGVAVDRADAWGDPAAGCYAVWLSLHGGEAAAPALAAQVLASLDAAAPVAPKPVAAPPAAGAASGPKPAGARASSPALAVSELAAPTAPEGELAFRFARPPYRGRVRASLGHGRIAAVACFANQREPASCEAACTNVLQQLPPVAATAGGAR